MEALFLKLVNMSITASYLVIAVIAFRLVLHKAPRWIHASAWGLVGLRLALPFSFESFFSLIPSTEPLPEKFLYAATPQIQTGIPAVNNSLNPIIAETLTPDPLTSANPTQILSFIFANIWLVGLTVMLIYAIVSYCVVRRKVGPSIPMDKQIRLCDHIDTPFILGIFRPKIYLPSALDEDTAAHVLAHEKAHLARKDHWWKPLGYLLLCVYWFNPLMWVAYILLCRDIEMACDEKVIRDMDPVRKKAYSAALLSCSVPRRLIAACPLAFGEVGVKQRIKSVLNYKKPAFWVIVVAVIASIVVAVCFLTDPAGKALTFLAGENTDTVKSITVSSGEDNYGVYTEKGIENVLTLLEEVRISSGEISQNRSEDRDATHTITLHYERIDCRYCFSEDFTEVWYDDGVKPTLTYQVKNPERIREFFPIAMEAPAADRLEPGEYVTTELVYWPVYSSTLAPYDVVDTYTVTENGFYFWDGGNPVDVYWQWRRVADCVEELKFFLDWCNAWAEVTCPGFPEVTDSSKYQKIDDNHHLFQIDGQLYLVEGFDSGKSLTNVSTIYRLANKEDIDVPVTYPESTIEGQENHLYSTYSGQIYDVRSAQDMLIRNAILENNPMSGSVSFESHQILSEMLGCGAAEEEGAPVGFTVVDVIAVVTHASLNEKTIPFSEDNYQIINATITYERYADGTLKRTEYQENEIGDLEDYDLTPLYQQCYDQAVKYWGLDTHLMADSLLDAISSSPAQYSSADPYIEAHREEYDRLIYLGTYTLTDCFDAFLNNRATGIRAEIMAAACRDIGKSLGENIDFEGQYINGSSWFDAFHENALALYETSGLDALEKTNPASWLLLNQLGQTPAPAGLSAEIVRSEHFSNAISLHVDVKFPESIDVGAMEEIQTPESVMLDYTSKRGEQSINATSCVHESVDAQSNTIHYHFIFDLYMGEPTDNHFFMTLSGFPEVSASEAVTLNWQADVEDARVFTAKSGDSEVTLTISPYLVNVEFTNPDYDSMSGLYDSIQIRDTDGRLLPIKGPYGGGESAYRMSLSITLLEPVDIDSIETVKVGGLILE